MTKTTMKTNYMKPTMTESPLFGRGLGEAPFAIQSYGFGQLAQMYYPDHNYQSALRHFREEMHLTRGMWAAMTAVGYKEKLKYLSRSQVRTIVQFLGEP
jgi:hypothetical protein